MTDRREVCVVDGGWRSNADADHGALLLAPYLGPDALVATHVLRAPEGRRVCLATNDASAGQVAQALPDADAVLSPVEGPAAEVAAAHRARTSGRLVVFSGSAGLRGRRQVADIAAGSEVEVVVGLAGAEVDPGSVVDLGDFVRPVWREGRCELVVQQGRDGLVPFEVRHQIACCSDH